MEHTAPQLSAIIESLLFTKGEPIEEKRLVTLLECTPEECTDGLLELERLYEDARSGLMLLRLNGKVQLVTKANLAIYVEKLIKNDLHGALSKSSLEVLAIIAYRGPISKVKIEAIRGVNCSYAIRALTLRGLIEKFDDPNDERSKLYRISFTFLKKLGVSSVQELPDFIALSADQKIATVEDAAQESAQT
jgi:segregation and condensation protein B